MNVGLGGDGPLASLMSGVCPGNGFRYLSEISSEEVLFCGLKLVRSPTQGFVLFRGQKSEWTRWVWDCGLQVRPWSGT